MNTATITGIATTPSRGRKSGAPVARMSAHAVAVTPGIRGTIGAYRPFPLMRSSSKALLDSARTRARPLSP
jgi:hypothetical protein